MATLRDIRRRISSVKSTQQITRAMKMVSAAKLRRAQDRILNARPYAVRLNELVSQIAAGSSTNSHPLFEQREVNHVTLITVTSDKGLCGSFNANIIKQTKDLYDSVPREGSASLITIGRKGEEFFRRRNYPIADRLINIFQDLSYLMVKEVSESIQTRFLNGETDRVALVYNNFKSVGSQELITEQILPVPPVDSDEDSGFGTDYIYEPDAAELLGDLVPRNLTTQIWRALLESNAAEHAARMVAMESATENAEEMIYDLTLHYNKARQAAITTEISEIVGGAEALRG